MTRLPSPTKETMRYYPSTCPVCAGTALAADITVRKVDIQCARCGGYEITVAARSAMRGMSWEHRMLWLSQARQKTSDTQRIAFVACANELQT